MELKLINGLVRWAKKDGTASNKAVSDLNTISFLGFPIPGADGCSNVKILLGDPYKNNQLIVKASGSTWFGVYYIDYTSQEYLQLAYNAQELIQKGEINLENASEHFFKSFRHIKIEQSTELNPETLSQEKGLDVVTDNDLFWIKGEKKYVSDLPADWEFLPKGDALLTKEVKKGPHWNLHKVVDEHYEKPGIFAPEENITQAFERLGGEEGQAKRLENKKDTQRLKESQFDEKLASVIRENYPNIPQEDLQDIVGTARSQGRVGRAAFLYFTTKEKREEEFRVASNLAVKAHIRHNYTEYEELLSNGHEREEARRMIQAAIHDKLEEWG